ncbi:olfactory receptor 6F1-like [Pleurodeles waltl]|uniref:olfactory receptor 6F1-like n=1 Tax=Pleurodeles waltl TaxID=8319 RepID=UPI003709B8E5
MDVPTSSDDEYPLTAFPSTALMVSLKKALNITLRAAHKNLGTKEFVIELKLEQKCLKKVVWTQKSRRIDQVSTIILYEKNHSATKSHKNESSVKEFHLVGFSSQQDVQLALFGVLLVTYTVTVAGNMVILVLVWVDASLHKPMYFFIANLSSLEICYTSVIVPKTLENLVSQSKVITFFSCLVQLYFFGAFGGSESLLLAVMAYDRFLAICKPLHYSREMSNRSSCGLAVTSWVGGFLSSLVPNLIISRLPFCGPTRINHFFCDVFPLLKLSCGNTYASEISIFLFSLVVGLGSFLLILVSYAQIIRTILCIPSRIGRQKAFSTCFSHITVVGIYYGTVTTMYVAGPRANSSEDLSKVLALQYTVLTPLLNPVIYTLRNKEVKDALHKVICRKHGFAFAFYKSEMLKLWLLKESKLPISLHIILASSIRFAYIPTHIPTSINFDFVIERAHQLTPFVIFNISKSTSESDPIDSREYQDDQMRLWMWLKSLYRASS